MTDNLGQSQVIPYLIGLRKKGHSFDILSFEKSKNFAEKKEQVQKLLEANGIGWFPLSYTKKPPVISTLHDVWRMIRTSQNLHNNEKYDLIHCRSYLPALAGLLLKKKFNVRFLFDMRGFWPDERVDGKIWNLRNPVYKVIYQYFKKKELAFFNIADHIICLTYAGYNEISKWNINPKQLDKFTIIPCCTDFDLFSIQEPNTKLLAELNLNKGNKIIVYIGSLGTWYMAEEMLSLFKAIKETEPDAKFLFITPEPRPHVMELVATSQIMEDDVRVVMAARKMVPQYLSLAHAGVSFIKPCYSKLSSSPTKMGEMFACGIPVYCNGDVGDVQQYIEKTEAGFLVNTFSDDEIKNAAAHFQKLIEMPKEMIRERASNLFNLTRGVQLYANAYEAIRKMDEGKIND
jgi:glycosyltransferase involved in cell wall biosynthesis